MESPEYCVEVDEIGSLHKSLFLLELQVLKYGRGDDSLYPAILIYLWAN